jgi:hypothetical protein
MRVRVKGAHACARVSRTPVKVYVKSRETYSEQPPFVGQLLVILVPGW